MFYCAHDYYSLFSIPLTFIYQLKSDRCPSEQRAQACTAKQNLKSLSSDFIAYSSLIHLIFTHTLSTNSHSLLSEIQIFSHTPPQTPSFINSVLMATTAFIFAGVEFVTNNHAAILNTADAPRDYHPMQQFLAQSAIATALTAPARLSGSQIINFWRTGKYDNGGEDGSPLDMLQSEQHSTCQSSTLLISLMEMQI